jgi:hypothetical protein
MALLPLFDASILFHRQAHRTEPKGKWQAFCIHVRVSIDCSFYGIIQHSINLKKMVYDGGFLVSRGF